MHAWFCCCSFEVLLELFVEFFYAAKPFPSVEISLVILVTALNLISGVYSLKPYTKGISYLFYVYLYLFLKKVSPSLDVYGLLVL